MMPFEQVITDTLGYLIAAGVGALITAFMTLHRAITKQTKRGLRQSQAILLMAKSIDNFTKNHHPGSESDLHAKAKITLEDEKGEL